MTIFEVIRRKGSDVFSIAPGATVGQLVNALHKHNVGAVVCLEGENLTGIVSERDVMRGLLEYGTELLDRPVSSIMVKNVETCTTDDKLEDLALRMTELRIRHVPVVEDGALLAIVSIGDVVHQRLENLQAERDSLIRYVTS